MPAEPHSQGGAAVEGRRPGGLPGPCAKGWRALRRHSAVMAQSSRMVQGRGLHPAGRGSLAHRVAIMTSVMSMVRRTRDWFVQAERDLDQARDSQAAARHEWACFASHQAAEKAVRALHLHLGQEAGACRCPVAGRPPVEADGA